MSHCSLLSGVNNCVHHLVSNNCECCLCETTQGQLVHPQATGAPGVFVLERSIIVFHCIFVGDQSKTAQVWSSKCIVIEINVKDSSLGTLNAELLRIHYGNIKESFNFKVSFSPQQLQSKGYYILCQDISSSSSMITTFLPIPLTLSRKISAAPWINGHQAITPSLLQQ